MAKSNPLYQGPGAVFDNPLYQGSGMSGGAGGGRGAGKIYPEGMGGGGSGGGAGRLNQVWPDMSSDY